MNYIVNLFGTGIRYWICEIPNPIVEEMNKIRLNHQVEWERLLFDFDILNHFGYTHWSELSSFPEQTGFLLDPQNRIEIKQGAKFITRFRAHELMNEETLFPLYQTFTNTFHMNKSFEKKLFVLILFEKGQIGKFQFNADQFTINDLYFGLVKMEDLYFIKDLHFKQQRLQNSSNDSLSVSSRVINF